MPDRLPVGEELLAGLLPALPLFLPRSGGEGGQLREIPLGERIREMTEYSQEEILELVWTLREEGRVTRTQLLRDTSEEEPERLIGELGEMGLLETSGEEIRLTREGEARASGIIRRHRLAEGLLHNLFALANHPT